MATSQVVPLALDSVDVSNLSVVTAVPSPTDPRAGAIYNTVSLAAAQPIWFHPQRDGSHLMCVSRTWSAATPVGGTPGVYSAFTESLAPGWYSVDGMAGTISTPSTPLTLKTPTTSATLVAGASKPSDLLFLLHSVQISGHRQAVLQYWKLDNSSIPTPGGEEVLPATATVVFDKGIQYASPYLYLYGTDASGHLHRIRKYWNRVGYNTHKGTDQRGLVQSPGAVWEYYTGTGWSASVADLAPIQDGFTSDGPLSFGYWQSYTYVSTVANTAGTYTAKVWYSNKGLPFKVVGAPVALGGAGVYLGGGLQLQSQVGANPTALDAGHTAGIPYLTSKKIPTSGHYSLANTWDVWPVSLVG